MLELVALVLAHDGMSDFPDHLVGHRHVVDGHELALELGGGGRVGGQVEVGTILVNQELEVVLELHSGGLPGNDGQDARPGPIPPGRPVPEGATLVA
jgi:hypothetical protein